ncbi:MAG: ABC transporter permease [Lachnospiraceae bacterium]|nr:ABC transporter permease [Lachnospiraceae bacterium]
MKKWLMEVIYSLKQNNGMICLLLFLCVLCFGGSKILFSYLMTMEQESDQFEKTYTEQNIYQVACLFDGGYEDYEKPENYGKLAQWNEALHESNVVTFVEVSKQYLNKHEGNERHDGLYVGKNYFEVFSTDISSGRYFTEDEYVYEEGKCMPIIMGAAYREDYELGDCFLADTVFFQTEVCVVGFVEQGEIVGYNEVMVKADDYIFFPMINLPEMERIEETSSTLMYMKNCGIAKTGMSRTETQDYFYHISDRIGMPGVFVIPGAANQRIPGMVISMQEIMQTSRTMLMVLCVITVLLLMFYISRKMKRNWNYYSILFLLGFSRKEVFAVMLGDTVLLLMVANLLSELCFKVWVVFTDSVKVGVWFNLLGSVILLLVPFLFSIWGFFRKDLYRRMEEEGSYL